MAKRTVEEVAIALAADHKLEDPETEAVYLSEDAEEVRLVEISRSMDTMGEVLPFRFVARPDLGVEYDATVVLLSLEEWNEVKAGKLHLPVGWGRPDDLKQIA